MHNKGKILKNIMSSTLGNLASVKRPTRPSKKLYAERAALLRELGVDSSESLTAIPKCHGRKSVFLYHHDAKGVRFKSVTKATLDVYDPKRDEADLPSTGGSYKVINVP